MVEVVIAFAKGDESSNHMVAWGVAIVKRLVPKPVGKGVDAEGGLLDKEDAKDATVDETTEPIAPAKATDEHREDEAHEEYHLKVMTMLPNDDRVLIEVGDVCAANSLGVLLHQHPPKVGIEETFADGIWIFVGVGVSVMCAVITSPPSYRAFDGTPANSCKKDPEREGSRVRRVGP